MTGFMRVSRGVEGCSLVCEVALSCVGGQRIR